MFWYTLGYLHFEATTTALAALAPEASPVVSAVSWQDQRRQKLKDFLAVVDVRARNVADKPVPKLGQGSTRRGKDLIIAETRPMFYTARRKIAQNSFFSQTDLVRQVSHTRPEMML
jgi:hypothetical protein